jgi:hypothetical protein
MSAIEIFEFVKKKSGLHYPNVLVVSQILSTIPVVVPLAERSLSKLNN